jgi:predicted Zn-dependent protease
MTSLDRPDYLRLNAAQGWFELDNCIEANAELEALSPAAQDHPEVLDLRWQIAVTERRWEQGVTVAEAQCRVAPESPFGWIHRAYCLHKLKRTQDAWDTLLPLGERFPTEWLIRYNLACYACQLGRLSDAQVWLKRASEIGDAEQIQKLAATDPDLSPLFSAPG